MPTAQQEAERLRKLGVKEIEVIEHPPEPNPGRPARQGVIVVNNLTRDADLQTGRQIDNWTEYPTDMAKGLESARLGLGVSAMQVLDRETAAQQAEVQARQQADRALWAEVYHQLPAELRTALEAARQRFDTAQHIESDFALNELEPHERRKQHALTFEQQRAWRRLYDSLKETHDAYVATIAAAYSAYETVAQRAHQALFALALDTRTDAQIAQQQAEEEARILEQLARTKRDAAAARLQTTGRLLDHINQQSPTALFEEV